MPKRWKKKKRRFLLQWVIQILTWMNARPKNYGHPQ
jgi:hypothetical protein